MKAKGFLTAFLTGLMLCGVFSTQLLSNGLTAGVVEAYAAEKEYAATSFTQVPQDWALNAACDTAQVQTSAADGELILKHAAQSNPGASKYYGAMYQIAKDQTWSDFTFEMNFRMSDPIDSSRWFGVVFHQHFSGANPYGYLVNYRYNGQTAASAISANREFKDEANDQGPALSDGKYHTLTVQMSGNTVKHYMDDQLIKTWDVSIKNSVVGGSVLTDGGFSLIVNCSTLHIRSIHITDTVTEKKTPTVDSAIVDTYQAETSIINAPTVVCDVVNQAVLEEMLASTQRPSNAILRFNADADVLDENGGILGSFTDIYKKLNKKIIPIVQIEDVASADAFVKYMKEAVDILDIAVLSHKPTLIKRVKETHSHVRGIVAYVPGQCETDYEIVSTTNSNYANVVLLPQSMATRERVEYIQARFKTVWVMPEDNTDINLYASINSGAYGIVTDNFAVVYDVMAMYPVTNIRPIFNVAHRGLPNKYNENSLSGTIAALNSGATHVELDGKVTTDGKILMMHDDEIARTATGSGNIENMTYDQARQHKLDLHEPKDENIPSLDEIMEVMKGKDAILVFEIKTNKEAIIAPLKEAIERHDFWDQIVVIAFDEIQLVRMKESMPQVPTANLNVANAASFGACLKWMGQYNTGIDDIHSQTSVEFNQKYLRDRGIIGWYWTFSGFSDIDQAAKKGYIGITNNDADTYANALKSVNAEGYTLKEGEEFDVARGDQMSLILTTYGGEQKTVTGAVSYVEDLGKYYGVIASYTYEEGGEEYTLYTELIKVHKAVQPDEESPLLSRELIRMLGIGIGAFVVFVILCKIIFRKKNDEPEEESENGNGEGSEEK